MKNLKNLDRLQKLHDLIDQECTGTPLELAEKMDLSRRAIFVLLEQLKDFGAEINYSRKNKTYHYCEDFELRINISVSVISNDELSQIFAGSYFLTENPSVHVLCTERTYICNIKTKLCA